LLREIRDNKVLSTESGSSFMESFNTFYYSFSPTVADWERESPAFRDLVKITITPLLMSLSILNHVDINSEHEMLGYGIGIILMNVGMYFVAPTMVIHRIKNR
ncbi:MAG TPA: CFI-box-CTERM domain-containing protein, partial [Nitrosopumilaceae archaeon]|nr:CFI-box-CTERM domain-containing protein [Nitrosopumilaceae archaeon]